MPVEEAWARGKGPHTSRTRNVALPQFCLDGGGGGDTRPGEFAMDAAMT
ncbi:hypothetical protein SAMN02745898_1011288 [Streptomyces sp. 136MFCol5.1]|nr:hypothetical protein SAMN02745898_1011288 [Streptomyces sp. 136MFCol5.1]